MSIKDIYTVIDLYKEASAAQAVALSLGARFKAHVTGVAPVLEPLVPSYLAAPVPVDYVMVAIQEAEKLAKEASEKFLTAANAAGVTAATRTLTALAGTTSGVVAQAHLSDLVVIGQETEDASEPMRGALIEAMLFDAGVPTLVIPNDYNKPFEPDLAIVAWDGSRTAARAVHAAMCLLSETKKVEVLMVGGGQETDGDPGADVAVYLARHGLSVSVRRLERTSQEPAEQLIGHAEAAGADYLVMGGYGHSRLREFVLGGTTRTMLEQSTLPVLMAH